MKHCFMILAHNQQELLKMLIKQLDYENNTIIVHIDKKLENFNIEDFYNLVQAGKIVFFKDRLDVKWGGSSLMMCEINLMNEAMKYECDYYHLLSGVDLMIKNNNYFNEFFEKHNGEEFFVFDQKAMEIRSMLSRVRYYHLPVVKFSNRLIRKSYNIFRSSFVNIQKFFGVNRCILASNMYAKGNNWFSCTQDFLKYSINYFSEWEKIGKSTYCIDEVFMITIFYNSPYFKNNSKIDIRYIDWSNPDKGSPAILDEDYIIKLNCSECLFARKFDNLKSNKLIDSIALITKNIEYCNIIK